MEEDRTIRQEAVNNLEIQSNKNQLAFNSTRRKTMHCGDKSYNFCCKPSMFQQKRRESTWDICLL